LSLVTRHSPLVLFLASANRGKLREFQQAARPLGIAVKVMPDFRQLPPCVEDGATFEENARKKALHYSAFTNDLVFADDSGLCVDALGGAPGVHSARFAGPDATDETNNRKLLAELGRVESSRADADAKATPTNRNAHYICVIALAKQGQIVTVVKGRTDGMIIDERRGAGGFGYDPHFLYPPLGRTFAEITAEEKFAVSHRGEAFRRLLAFLKPR
jgi:XTP/dITP diphosphohydrolase